MTIKATAYDDAVKYEGTREDLIACALATPDMFPKPRQPHVAKFQGRPVGKAKTGRYEWVVFREKAGRYSVQYTNEYLELHTERA